MNTTFTSIGENGATNVANTYNKDIANIGVHIGKSLLSQLTFKHTIDPTVSHNTKKISKPAVTLSLVIFFHKITVFNLF